MKYVELINENGLDNLKRSELLEEIPNKDFNLLANHPEKYDLYDIVYVYEEYLSDRKSVCMYCRTRVDGDEIEMVEEFGDGYFNPKEYLEVCPYCRREYLEDEQTLEEWLNR